MSRVLHQRTRRSRRDAANRQSVVAATGGRQAKRLLQQQGAPRRGLFFDLPHTGLVQTVITAAPARLPGPANDPGASGRVNL